MEKMQTKIEGDPTCETIVFVHGWPDDGSVWNRQVEVLKDKYQCVRVTAPHFDGQEKNKWGYDHDEIVELLKNTIKQVSPNKKVILMIHDWGAYWGYCLHKKNPDLISKIICLDIGGHFAPKFREKLMIISYQWYLVVAFLIGGKLGDMMTQWIARIFKGPRDVLEIKANMNYPYFYTWKNLFLRKKDPLKNYKPMCPILFFYGKKKPFMFHSEKWLNFLAQREDCKVIGVDAGHWVNGAKGFNREVLTWLGV